MLSIKVEPGGPPLLESETQNIKNWRQVWALSFFFFFFLRLCLKTKTKSKGYKYKHSSVIQHWPSMFKALGSTPSTPNGQSGISGKIPYYPCLLPIVPKWQEGSWLRLYEMALGDLCKLSEKNCICRWGNSVYHQCYKLSIRQAEAGELAQVWVQLCLHCKF